MIQIVISFPQIRYRFYFKNLSLAFKEETLSHSNTVFPRLTIHIHSCPLDISAVLSTLFSQSPVVIILFSLLEWGEISNISPDSLLIQLYPSFIMKGDGNFE